jgi:O-6-methylguanine DNA methyltransferase
VKSAAKTPDGFDAILPLGDVALQAPTSLRQTIQLGIRLTPEGDALDALVFLTDPPSRRTAYATVCGIRDPLLEDIRRQLTHWFIDPAYVFTLPLGLPRTAFQKRLRQALCATQAGDLLTYAELSTQLQSAPRAVGQALGSNTLPLIVPCHRIISAGRNRLTGFNHASDGPMLTLKAWLLDRENPSIISHA